MSLKVAYAPVAAAKAAASAAAAAALSMLIHTQPECAPSHNATSSCCWCRCSNKISAAAAPAEQCKSPHLGLWELLNWQQDAAALHATLPAVLPHLPVIQVTQQIRLFCFRKLHTIKYERQTRNSHRNLGFVPQRSVPFCHMILIVSHTGCVAAGPALP